MSKMGEIARAGILMFVIAVMLYGITTVRDGRVRCTGYIESDHKITPDMVITVGRETNDTIYIYRAPRK